MILTKITNYLIILTFFIVIFLIVFSCNTFNINENYKIIEGEELILDKSLLKNIKINNKILLLDVTNDIKLYKKNNDTTDDVLNTGNFIYKKEDIDNFKLNIDFFYNFIKNDLKKEINEKKFNIQMIFATNENIENSAIKTIIIEIEEYYNGEYNLIKNKITKFKISVKIIRKDLINTSNVLFIKNYKCKPSILFPSEKLRIKKISELCTKDIIKILIDY